MKRFINPMYGIDCQQGVIELDSYKDYLLLITDSDCRILFGNLAL